MNEVFADSVGWSDIAEQVLAFYDEVPAAQRPGTVIVSAYYGVPGALQIYGNPATRPIAVSPQLSAYYWLPANLGATDALLVDYQPEDVAWLCDAPTLVGHLRVPFEVEGLEQGAPVTACHLREPLPQAWPRLRNFS